MNHQRLEGQRNGDDAAVVADVAEATGGPIVTSCDDVSDGRSLDDSDDEGPQRYSGQDELFDDHADDDDEAYVYKNLRSGVEETITIVKNNGQGSNVSTMREQIRVYKPRYSDAVLSCPCCFRIVCMDCQRHERYHDQYRAMFVMGITVRWDHVLVYDERAQGLVRKDHQHSGIAEAYFSDMPKFINKIAPEVVGSSADISYYAVYCANCETQVAALDMEDEVYHFYGCLAST